MNRMYNKLTHMHNALKTSLIMIKIGGSLITDKSKPSTANVDEIDNCWLQIKKALELNSDLKIILAHGQGSFAHFPAKKYQLSSGLNAHPDGKFGLSITTQEVRNLHQIVLERALKLNLPVTSFFCSNLALLKNGETVFFQTEIIEQALDLSFIPVTTGDVIFDQEKGCSIWSADKILPELTQSLIKKNYQIDKFIHVTQTPGVYKKFEEPQKGVFKTITPSQLTQISSSLSASHLTDVTGGMKEKVDQLAKLAQQGFESVILNPQNNNLLNELIYHHSDGTRILPD